MTSFRVLKILILAVSSLTLFAQTTGSDTAIQQSVRLDVPDSSAFAFATYTVPVGRRLVIRYLAVTATLPSGQRVTSSVQAWLRGEPTEFPQGFLAQNNGDGTDELVSNQAVTIVADSDSTVHFQVFRRNPKGGVRVIFAFTGDLLPMP